MSLESTAPAEVQARAKEMGWIGPENFKGDPEKFVDADAYIERGETVLPIVKATLAKERTEFAEFRRQASLTATALAQLQERQKEADIRNAAETQRAVDQAIAKTKADLARASEAGDHAAVAELTSDLVELDGDKKAAAAGVVEAAKPAEKAKPTADAGAAEQLRLTQEWIADGNQWFNTDRRRQSLMQGIAMELREKGNTLEGKAFMNACKAEMLKTLGESDEPIDKVSSGRNGDGSESQIRSGGKKGFNSLPAAAKEQCAIEAKQFVGPNKRYKTAAEWNARYAEIYFEKE